MEMAGREPSESEAVRLLESEGADAILHPGGTLLAHLRRTAETLVGWDAPQSLVLAGLCHAVYGSDGFDRPLLGLSARDQLAGVIGPDGEAIVYFYGSCDRGVTYPELARGRHWFRDRFTGEFRRPPPGDVCRFMELTFANELDVARQNPSLIEAHWPQLATVFSACGDLVSPGAWKAFLTVDHSMRTGQVHHAE